MRGGRAHCRWGPPQIELSLSQLRVMCELRGGGGGAGGGPGEGGDPGGGGTQPALEVDALEHTMQLRGGERCWVREPPHGILVCDV